MKKMGVFLAVIFLAGCSSSKTLSRSKAQEILENYFKAKGPYAVFQPTSQEESALIAKHLIIIKPDGMRGMPDLTPDGKSLFSDLTPSPHDCCYLTTAAPLKHVVVVTGIRNVPGDSSGAQKYVAYTWHFDFDHSPEEMRTIFKDHPAYPEEEVVMQLYDDGWRLVQ